ncbi:hypothetical protein [Janthinobacterium sp. BJB401]|uniref:hypothetical protein n=1 Tax=Janthinobacterium sp. BJB401 TaxID=2745934 RepID=UPI001594E81A|nr:hypothetical protein [Janthinobacterium sp. BJB401]NVI84172.1 hypothetical protein [Janthinobacterium sp. BJB401]
MSISIANAVPGPFDQWKNPLSQSEKVGKRLWGPRSVAVTRGNSDVTFGVNNVSHLFQSIHFETLNETCNRQENSAYEKKPAGAG